MPIKQTTLLFDLKLLARFFKNILPYKSRVIFGIVMMMINIASVLLIPFLLEIIIDDYLNRDSSEGYLTLMLYFTAIVVVSYITEMIYSYSLSYAGQQAICDLRYKLYLHCIKLPTQFFDNTPIGIVLTRLTSDFEAIGESISTGVLTLFTDIIKTFFLISVLLYMNLQLGLIVLIIVPFVIFVTSVIRKILRKLYRIGRKALADAISYLQECLQGMATIQLYNAESQVLNKYNQKNLIFRKAQNKSNFFESFLTAFIEAATSISIGIIIWYASSDILASLLTLGILFSFINILQRLFTPIRELSQRLTAIQRALSAIQQVDRLMQMPTEEHQIKKVQKQPKIERFEMLEFDNVSFSYKENVAVLNQISFQLKKGDKFAIIGKTGSGKSTLFKLLLKHYTHFTGQIKINGIDLQTLQREQITPLFASMSQTSYLFDDTIKRNIDLKNKLDQKELEEISARLELDKIIEKLPQRYQSELHNNGANLSEGEMQLITIARVLSTYADVILLDEATASIDSLTEQIIQNALEKLFKDKTMIAIAHRLSTIENSDQIIVLEQGRIIEQGTPRDLKKQNGYFSELINL